MTSWRPAAPRRPEAGDEAVEVLARGGDGEELVGLAARQLEELLLDVGLAAQAVRAARGAQRRALAEQPVDAAQALVASSFSKRKPVRPWARRSPV